MLIIYISEQELFLLKKMQQVCCKTEACRVQQRNVDQVSWGFGAETELTYNSHFKLSSISAVNHV